VCGQGVECNGCDGLLELTVGGPDSGCNGCDDLLELNVLGQDGGCTMWFKYERD